MFYIKLGMGLSTLYMQCNAAMLANVTSIQNLGIFNSKNATG